MQSNADEAYDVFRVMCWLITSVPEQLVIFYHNVSGRMSNFDYSVMSTPLTNIFGIKQF